jgi:beta-1,4-mannosyl-glycoprotein beta-1,4-N-acetylglucosaminyltransferase
VANAVHGLLNSAPFKAVFHRRGFRRRLRRNHPFVWRFQHTIYMYYLNCRCLDPVYGYGTVMLRYRDFSTGEELRHSGFKTVPDAGWNFTWMGGLDRIVQKARAFAHQECDQPQFTDPEHILECLRQGRPIFGGREPLQFVPVDESFPAFVRQHPDKFSTWIRPL